MIVTQLDPIQNNNTPNQLMSSVRDMLNGHAYRAMLHTHVSTNRPVTQNDEQRAAGHMRVAIEFVVEIRFSVDPEQEEVICIVTEDPDDEWRTLTDLNEDD